MKNITSTQCDGMMRYIGLFGALHSDGCPTDDTCNCEVCGTNKAVSACCVFLHNAPSRITALESDLATARAERDAAVAAGRILAVRIATATRMDVCDDLLYRADEMDTLLRSGIGGGTKVDDNTNPLALAWVKAAQEASNGK